MPRTAPARGGAVVRVLLLLLLWVTAFAVPASRAVELTEAQTANRSCFNCHGQLHLAEMGAAERRSMLRDDGAADDASAGDAPRPGLYVAPNALSDTVHAGLRCLDCHADAGRLPHVGRLAEANCQGCHAGPAIAYRRGAHAGAAARGVPDAPGCPDCHGGHGILRSENRAAHTYPLNVVKICAGCHEQHRDEDGGTGAARVEGYVASVHGQAISKGGLVVAATCVQCHRSHEVRPAADPESSVSRAHVPQTCGQCHIGVSEIYATSVHGLRLAEGDADAPVCTDCHTAHRISHASTPGFMRDIVGECGGCHDRSPTGGRSFYDTYRLSYHGQVTELGSTRAARCSDCHGAHDILPIADPASRLNPGHRRDTCAGCHPGANASFARYEPHADHHDGDRYPLLHGVWLYFVILMSVTFGFYGVHSVLWLCRSVLDRRRDGPPPRHPADHHAIQRFTRLNRVNHALVVITFFGLTLTGMPLLFSDQDWAKALAALLGGVRGAGWLHRLFAIALFGNVIAHVVGLIGHARRTSVRAMAFGPNTLLPRWRDVLDFTAMCRWFLGGPKPTFDRWTYWEKFDYWAEIFGTGIIGFTGLMLWFPIFFSRFLPGWLFNIAMIVHGYEALLAVGFIFTIHFFNAHLRLEKFPVDDVIFTGQLPEAEFRHERGAEYERVKASGALAALRVPVAPRWWRGVAVVIGLLAMAIGIAMVALIVLAGLGVL